MQQISKPVPQTQLEIALGELNGGQNLEWYNDEGFRLALLTFLSAQTRTQLVIARELQRMNNNTDFIRNASDDELNF